MTKFIVEAGCDSAMVCAFDAAALPHNFDELAKDEPLGVMEKLQQEGRLWIDGTGGEGSFIFHIFVDEPVIHENESDSRIIMQSEFRPLACPSGLLWVCDAEYAANDPRKGSAHTPEGGLDNYDMGGSIEIKKGTHNLRVIQRKMSEEEKMDTLVPFRWTTGVEILGILFFLLGGLAAFFSALSFIIGSLGKLYQWMVATSPLFEKVWHVLPVMGCIFFAGIVSCLIGILVMKRVGSMKTVVAERAMYQEKRRQIPDYIFEIQTEKV